MMYRILLVNQKEELFQRCREIRIKVKQLHILLSLFH